MKASRKIYEDVFTSSVGKVNLKKTLEALVIKEEIDKLDSITFKNFFSLEDTIKRPKKKKKSKL